MEYSEKYLIVYSIITIAGWEHCCKKLEGQLDSRRYGKAFTWFIIF